jgi:DNA-binding NtrC family response regulator
MKQKLLIIEDDKNMRNLLRLEFFDVGYQVMTSTDASDAIDILNQCQFDLVMLDLKMPGMNCIETLTKIKKRNRFLPVLIHSGYRQCEEIFLTWPAVECIVKSGNVNSLINMLKKQLANSQTISLAGMGIY